MVSPQESLMAHKEKVVINYPCDDKNIDVVQAPKVILVSYNGQKYTGNTIKKHDDF